MFWDMIFRFIRHCLYAFSDSFFDKELDKKINQIITAQNNPKKCQKIGISKLQALADEIGAKFKVIKNHKHATNPNIFYFLPSTADPKFTQMKPPHNGGFMFWKWAYTTIIWMLDDDDLQMDATRQWLQNPHSHGNCWVCYKEVEFMEDIKCPKCSTVICPRCFFKHRIIGPHRMAMVCKGRMDLIRSFPDLCSWTCKTPFNIDLWDYYYQVMDRMEEFSPEQRECLEAIKKSDPKFEKMLGNWKQSKKLKVGQLVLLHDLKKEEWNGKVAVITGRVMSKDGVRRWPVQMKDDTKIKASIKECNLKMVVSAKTRFAWQC